MAEARSSNPSIEGSRQQILPECAWHELTEPGTHLDASTGDLYRIPKEALVTGASPVVIRETAGPSILRQLSKDPFMPSLKVCIMCAQHNIQPNF